LDRLASFFRMSASRYARGTLVCFRKLVRVAASSPPDAAGNMGCKAPAQGIESSGENVWIAGPPVFRSGTACLSIGDRLSFDRGPPVFDRLFSRHRPINLPLFLKLQPPVCIGLGAASRSSIGLPASVAEIAPT
jgi:hypothetical protein